MNDATLEAVREFGRRVVAGHRVNHLRLQFLHALRQALLRGSERIVFFNDERGVGVALTASSSKG